MGEQKLEKQQPEGLSEDLLLESSFAIPFIAEIMRHTWFASVGSGAETLLECIDWLKQNVGILPIYDSVFTVRKLNSMKYKPVAKKVVPMSTQDPGASIPTYEEIQVEELSKLPMLPRKMEEIKFMKRLTKERISSIISKIPTGFLMKSEAELLIHILFQYEWAIAFTDLEHRDLQSEILSQLHDMDGSPPAVAEKTDSIATS